MNSLKSSHILAGLDAVVHVGIPENELPTASNIGLFNISGAPTRFQELCMNIGRQLMSGSDDDATKARKGFLAMAIGLIL